MPPKPPPPSVGINVNGHAFIPGSPRIDNPGSLPMGPDEPGIPLIVPGRVLDGHGQPPAGVEPDIYEAADNGLYAGLYDDGVPKYNLRGHLFTDLYPCTRSVGCPHTGRGTGSSRVRTDTRMA